MVVSRWCSWWRSIKDCQTTPLHVSPSLASSDILSLHQFSFLTPAIPWVSVTIVTRLLNLANGPIYSFFPSHFSFNQPLSQIWLVDIRHHPRRYTPLPLQIKNPWDPRRNRRLVLRMLWNTANTKSRIINKAPIYSMDIMRRNYSQFQSMVIIRRHISSLWMAKHRPILIWPWYSENACRRQVLMTQGGVYGLWVMTWENCINILKKHGTTDVKLEVLDNMVAISVLNDKCRYVERKCAI